MFSDATAVDDDARFPRPLRIGIVLPTRTRGGAEVWQERLVREEATADVTVLAPHGSDALRRWQERSARTLDLRAGRRFRGAAASVVDLHEYLRTSRPDVVVAHGVKAALLTLTAAAGAGARVAWVRHDDSFPRLSRIVNMLADARLLGSEGARLAGDTRAVAIQGPLPGAPLTRAAARRTLGFDEGSSGIRRAVMATRLAPYKGVDVAIRALACLPAWKLHVFGVVDHAHPQEAERLTALAEQHGVGERFVLHPARDDAWSLLGAFDAALMLTRTDAGAHLSREAFGLTAYEAVRAGVPVVAASPVAEQLGAAGILVGSEDVDAVVAALRDCVRPERRRELLAAGPGVLATTVLEPDEAADRFTRLLAGTARRPGAGVRGAEPMSVVTTVLDEAEALARLLDDVVPLLGPDDELVVVDGGSRDGTFEVAQEAGRRDARVHVLRAEGAGISEGRNAGIAAAAHELIACTDVGCTPDPTWLEAFRSAAGEHPEAYLFTGVYTATARNAVDDAFAACGYPDVAELHHPSAGQRLYARAFGRAFRPEMPTGRSVAFRRAAWAEVGGFPENLPTGEDVTFGMRIAARHPALLVADAAVEWEQRPSVRSTLRMYYRYGQGSADSGNTRLVVRDGLRLLAYGGGAVLVTRGPLARTALAVGAVGYLGVPVRRALRRPRGVRAAALVPFATAARDVAKVAGALEGMTRQAKRGAHS